MEISFTYRKPDERPNVSRKPKIKEAGTYNLVVRDITIQTDQVNGDRTLWVNFDVIGEYLEYGAPFKILEPNKNEWDCYHFSRLLDACGVSSFNSTNDLDGKQVVIHLTPNKNGKLSAAWESPKPQNSYQNNQSFDYSRPPGFVDTSNVNASDETPF